MLCRTAERLREIFASVAGASAACSCGSSLSGPATPGTSVSLGFKSLQGAEILNGTRTGPAGFGAEVGTDGPLEAGTLSESDPPVPFGGSLKGIRVGAAEVEVV